MATLLSLPNETFLQIIDETRPDGIWSFVRCCKTVWSLGEKDLKLNRQDLVRYRALDFYSSSDKQIQVYCFLSQLLLQPRRVLYVNRVYTNRWRSFKTTPTKSMSTMIDEICSLIFKINCCPYIQDDEIDKWITKARRGNANAAICLMLTLLPNLKALTITGDNAQEYSVLISNILKAIGPRHRRISGPSPLGMLETITVWQPQRIARTNERLGIYEACMMLPSLRRIRGRGVGCAFDRWPSEAQLPRMSNVTEIILDQSAINAEAFTRLLMRTKNLQRLTYSFLSMSYDSGDFSVMSLKSILEQYAARTLTYLNLKAKRSARNGHGFIGSLRQFQVLQKIRIQADVFIESISRYEGLDEPVDLLPLLPASIETLILIAPVEGKEVAFTLKELQIKRKDYLLNLRNVFYERFISIAEGLIEECASMGISLVKGWTDRYFPDDAVVHSWDPERPYHFRTYQM